MKWDRRPFLIGLTGSIGMGKSTTASMFADEGVPTWDADETVKRLYAKGGVGVPAIRKLWSEAVIDDCVDRGKLKSWIAANPDALARIEAEIHPLVAEDRRRFALSADTDIALLDIPLLFETESEKDVNAVVVVSAPEDIQRARVLERGSMTEAQLDAILAKQMPDREKCARADYVIDTRTLEDAREAVHSCLQDIRSRLSNAGNRP